MFRRIVLPNILPGILSGLTMAFARAVGEVGSVILITGNLPYKTEVASVFILQRIDGDPHGAAAVSVVLLTISFAVLLLVGGSAATRRGTSVRKYRLRVLALGYLLIILIGPLAMMIWRTLGDLDGAWAAITDHNTLLAFKLTLS